MNLDHVTILVSSLAVSMPYYDRLLPLLGFRKLRDHVWTEGERFYLQFQEAHEGTRPYERYGAGMNHLGFSAPSAEAVLAVRDEMQCAGFGVPEIQNLGGVVALFMQDPDGIRFEISYYPPGTSVVD
jgi:catechol 2,3-dioxygenase-like lactoylglutathione lyase family enzyme